jgi:hypothetical protein
MKRIQLAGNKGVALVDDVDFNKLNQYRWHKDAHGCAVRTVYVGGKRTIYMHRVIMGVILKLRWTI